MAQFDDQSIKRISRTVRGWERRLKNPRGHRGRWQKHGTARDELFWCVLMEDHPGKGKCFDILIGTWCPAEGGYRFDCESVDYEVGIDYHTGVPYPGTGARGWFKRMPCSQTASGFIYLCVSLDCESPGVCGAEGLDDELPCISRDPCAEEGSGS